MDVETHTFDVDSTDRHEIQKITAQIEAAVETVDATNGLVFVSTPHTTAALFTNEYEQRLTQDMLAFFEELVPPENEYRHDRHHVATETQPNAHAHIIASMIHTPVMIGLVDGQLQLGHWEDVLLADLDGPSTRTVSVSIFE